LQLDEKTSANGYVAQKHRMKKYIEDNDSAFRIVARNVVREEQRLKLKGVPKLTKE